MSRSNSPFGKGFNGFIGLMFVFFEVLLFFIGGGTLFAQLNLFIGA